MALGVDTHTHTHSHESEFKRPGACRPVTGVYLVYDMLQSFVCNYLDHIQYVAILTFNSTST